ncbi:MAG TPA: glycosyltransferase family 4 protein [Acidimicrobiales bacterium]|nr:glycosyltransferase family 4 protein [Acidimicrobiales bacterium]
MNRPQRIDQVVHILAARDAIGAHVLHTRQVLESEGYRSDIYASGAQPEVADLARPLESLGEHSAGRWLLFHHSTGATAAEAVRRRGEPVILDYHNVTPAALVAPWAPWLREELELGVEQLAELAPDAVFGIAHSHFSEAEMRKVGCRHTTTAAPLVDFDGLDTVADGDARRAMEAAKAAGGADWLFVGRVSPHKAQHDLVKAFACYRRAFDPEARLHLVGSALGEEYRRALERFCRRLGIADAVDMAGSVPAGVLAAYYASADVFVCASDHEGFCVPLVEAMHAGVPVVAYDAAAVGETVGDGGLVLEDKSPMALATAVHRVVSDGTLRQAMVRAGNRRAAQFAPAAGRARMAGAIAEAVEAGRRLGVS